MTQAADYIYILRTDTARTPATAAYRVTFAPGGNRDVYVHREDGLRIFLKEADVPTGHIERAVTALRTDVEHVVEPVRLTSERLKELGFTA